MQNQQPRRLASLGVIAGFSALVLATGGSVAWWTWTHSDRTAPNAVQHAQPTENGNSAATADPTKARNPQVSPVPATADTTLRVYWLQPTGTSIRLAPSAVKTASRDPDALLETALKQLLAGPPSSAVATTIPKGTQLRHLSIEPNGVHLDLSREFTSGGGSSSMEGRLAQVLYTATSLSPNTAVWLSVEGKPLTTLGGEGLELRQPITRQQFEQDFPL